MLTSAATLERQLADLLDESAQHAIEREQTEFDRLAGRFAGSIVLFGARKLGKRTLAGLRAAGVEPVAFADNNPQLWNSSLEGVNIYSPEEAVRRFGSHAAFVITIWGHGSRDTMAGRQRQLTKLGAQCVLPFVPLYWKFAESLLPHNALDLPHYVLQEAQDVFRCFHILSDHESREQFVRQIKWRLTGDFDALADPTPDEIYFPHEIALGGRPEVFIDCGAYDGDTILRFLARTNGIFQKIFAFEPDRTNWSALERTVSKLPIDSQNRIGIFPYAVGATRCTVCFSQTGTVGAAIGNGTVEVECVPLDDVLRDQQPTFIKMDVEASEPAALQGGSEIIRKEQPVIAACSYHVQNHAWAIPLIINAINPDYAILMRQHVQLVEDLVTYAVPPRRLLNG